MRARGGTSDGGQTTIEWLGISAVVVAFLAVLLLASPALGEQIATAVERLICEVSGGENCDAELENQVCVTSISRREAAGEVTIFSVGAI